MPDKSSRSHGRRAVHCRKRARRQNFKNLSSLERERWPLPLSRQVHRAALPRWPSGRSQSHARTELTKSRDFAAHPPHPTRPPPKTKPTHPHPTPTPPPPPTTTTTSEQIATPLAQPHPVWPAFQLRKVLWMDFNTLAHGTRYQRDGGHMLQPCGPATFKEFIPSIPLPFRIITTHKNPDRWIYSGVKITN